jgi:hypothetical protein
MRFSSSLGEGEEASLFFLVPFKSRRIGHSSRCSDRLAWPYRTLLSCGLVADGEHEIDTRAVWCGELIPTLGAQLLNVIAKRFMQFERQRMHDTFGWLPALKPLNRPLLQRLMAHSAITLRAELPVQRNNTLYSRLPIIHGR